MGNKTDSNELYLKNSYGRYKFNERQVIAPVKEYIWRLKSLLKIVLLILITILLILVSCTSTEPTTKEIPWTGEGPPPPPSPGTKWVIPKDREEVVEETETEVEYHIDLWNQVIAYRDQHATASFELDPSTRVISGELNITAYNADSIYLRSISFKLGGDGGYIGTYYIGPGQVGGEGTIGPLQTKTWVYDLSRAMIADIDSPEGYRLVDFVGIINNITQISNPIEVEAWVSTFTSTAWISASLHLEKEVTSLSANEITFSETKLEAVIRRAIDKLEATIFTSDLEGLNSLVATKTAT